MAMLRTMQGKTGATSERVAWEKYYACAAKITPTNTEDKIAAVLNRNKASLSTQGLLGEELGQALGQGLNRVVQSG